MRFLVVTNMLWKGSAWPWLAFILISHQMWVLCPQPVTGHLQTVSPVFGLSKIFKKTQILHAPKPRPTKPNEPIGGYRQQKKSIWQQRSLKGSGWMGPPWGIWSNLPAQAQSTWHRIVPRWFWNISTKGNSTLSLDSPFQCTVTAQ